VTPLNNIFSRKEKYWIPVCTGMTNKRNEYFLNRKVRIKFENEGI
jgi:hypothetical protein